MRFFYLQLHQIQAFFLHFLFTLCLSLLKCLPIFVNRGVWFFDWNTLISWFHSMRKKVAQKVHISIAIFLSCLCHYQEATKIVHKYEYDRDIPWGNPLTILYSKLRLARSHSPPPQHTHTFDIFLTPVFMYAVCKSKILRN